MQMSKTLNESIRKFLDSSQPNGEHLDELLNRYFKDHHAEVLLVTDDLVKEGVRSRLKQALGKRARTQVDRKQLDLDIGQEFFVLEWYGIPQNGSDADVLWKQYGPNVLVSDYIADRDKRKRKAQEITAIVMKMTSTVDAMLEVATEDTSIPDALKRLAKSAAA
jgi:hypothetical protein